MSKRNWFVGGIAVLLLLVISIYLFFPSDSPSNSQKQKEKKVSFLEVDSQWADSLVKTLSTEEKAAMLIMYQPINSSDSAFLSNDIPGAYLLSAENILALDDEIKNERSLLFSSFDQVPVTDKVKFTVPDKNQNTILGNTEIFFSLNDDSLKNESHSILQKACDFYHLDGIVLPLLGSSNKNSVSDRIFKSDTSRFLKTIITYGEKLIHENFLCGSSLVKDFSDEPTDSIHRSFEKMGNSSFPVCFIDSNLSVEKLKLDDISNYLKTEFKFNGLCISFIKKTITDDELSTRLLAGTDLLITNNFPLTKIRLVNLIRKGMVGENILNAKVKKILLAKTWSKMKRKKVTYEKVKSFTAYEKSFPRRIRKASFTLVRNDKSILPIRNVTNNKMAVLHLGHQPVSFTKNLYHYLPDQQTVPVKFIKDLKDHSAFNPSEYKKYQTVILTIHGDISQDKPLLEKINLLSKVSKLIILNFEFPENLSSLNNFSTIIQLWDDSVIESEFSAQAVFGGVKMNAILPFSFGEKLKSKKSYSLLQSRLQYTIPEDIGIASDSLAKISYIVEEGIRNKAFPGAQVFFALDGKVFYNRSFGTHTYTEKQEVKVNDLFDMASVTKVSATTIVAMSAFEKGLFKLNDSLYKHIPDTLKKHIHGKSTLRNITFKQILIHATGLAAGQPIIKYIRYRDSLIDKRSRFDKYYCDYSDDYFKIIVADGFYMEREQEDTIWYAMNKMSVDENPTYRYSDANMNLLYKLLNPKIKNRWRFYLDSLYYKPMGMFNSCYLPIQNEIKPERIVPTENDRYWRKQLLRGYVHDPTAALFGGVAGNAGLFSTAEDMGILFQMLMNMGSYGGNQFFKKETVELFISQQQGSHRGLGFNRQVKGNTYGVSPYASNNTFGHTGFTGISVWADMDIKLIYVSCTNRVHPDAENKKIINLGTTKRIHNVIYEQLKYLMPDKIDLN